MKGLASALTKFESAMSVLRPLRVLSLALPKPAPTPGPAISADSATAVMRAFRKVAGLGRAMDAKTNPCHSWQPFGNPRLEALFHAEPALLWTEISNRVQAVAPELADLFPTASPTATTESLFHLCCTKSVVHLKSQGLWDLVLQDYKEQQLRFLSQSSPHLLVQNAAVEVKEKDEEVLASWINPRELLPPAVNELEAVWLRDRGVLFKAGESKFIPNQAAWTYGKTSELRLVALRHELYTTWWKLMSVWILQFELQRWERGVQDGWYHIEAERTRLQAERKTRRSELEREHEALIRGEFARVMAIRR